MTEIVRKKPSLYIDATIPNYVFNDHVPDKQKAAKRLFDEAREGQLDILISQVLIDELDAAGEPKRSAMLKLIKGLTLLELVPEAERLANDYVERDIIPAENIDDARHIAIATFYNLDALVSYNFEHIVRIETIDKITAANLLWGFRSPKIIIPEEVIDVQSL